MTEKAPIFPFLPWIIKGIRMEDGSISFGPRDMPVVLGDVTNGISLADFVSAAVRGRRDFGASDTAVTQHRIANLIVAAPTLLERAIPIIQEERDCLFECHSINGELRIDDEADQVASDAIAEMDAWLNEAKKALWQDGGDV